MTPALQIPHPLAEGMCARCSIILGPIIVFSNQPTPRFTISAEFRRNSGKNSVSASYREEKFRYFSVNFVSKFKNSKKFVKKNEKNMIKN